MAVYQNPSLFTEATTAVTATNSVGLGTLRWEGGACYKYVYSEQSAAAGYLVNHVSNSSGYTVTASMTTGNLVAGIVQGTTLTTATYGWIMVNGVCTAEISANSAIVTNKLVCALSSGSFGDWNHYQNTLNSAATGGTLGDNYLSILGRTLGSGASGASILCTINVL